MGALVSGAKQISVAGTGERLTPSSTPAHWVYIQAKFENTDNVYIGDSTIDNNSGIALVPGATLQIGDLNRWFRMDLSQVWVDVAVNGEGVRFAYWSAQDD